MAAYLDSVPLSGIIRIRDLMFTVKDPFRLDQGDVSFDAPDTVKSAMARALAENKTHYVQTNGLPRLRELIAAKLRDKNRIPVDDPEHVLVAGGGIHGMHCVFQALLEPGDEVLVPDPEWPPAAGHVLGIVDGNPVLVAELRRDQLSQTRQSVGLHVMRLVLGERPRHRGLDGVRRVEAHVALIETKRILDGEHQIANADDAGERNAVEVSGHISFRVSESPHCGRAELARRVGRRPHHRLYVK